MGGTCPWCPTGSSPTVWMYWGISERTSQHRGFNTVDVCPPCPRKKAIEKDQHIKELKESFSSNVISLSDYVAGMSQHNNLWIL